MRQPQIRQRHFHRRWHLMRARPRPVRTPCGLPIFPADPPTAIRTSITVRVHRSAQRPEQPNRRRRCGRPQLAAPAGTVADMTEPARCLATVPAPHGPRPCRAQVWRDGVCWHHRQQAPPLPPVELRTLITRRYSKVRGLRARGIMSPASAPCEIEGCRNRDPLSGYRGRGTGYVYEHCHTHDYIRGVACGPCNIDMIIIDARVDTCTGWPRFGALLAWWLRCPTCAAGPPWEPWLTADEYNDGPMLAELADLSRTEPGSTARHQVMMFLALHGRAIIDRRRHRARGANTRAAAHAALARLRASVGEPTESDRTAVNSPASRGCEEPWCGSSHR